MSSFLEQRMEHFVPHYRAFVHYFVGEHDAIRTASPETTKLLAVVQDPHARHPVPLDDSQVT
jgi:hypothetical protein